VFFTGNSGSRVDTANIDHCHKRNIVRGILCWPCNTAIGKFGEDVERIRKAADYVERYAQNEATPSKQPPNLADYAGWEYWNEGTV
jgi:hypothetical protein